MDLPAARPAAAPVAAKAKAMNQGLRIVLVDDHALVRSGLRALLELEEGWQVVGEAGTVASALDVVSERAPDVVLVDLVLNGGPNGAFIGVPVVGSPGGREGGLELISQLRERHPSLQVVVLTTFLDPELVFDALRRGANGYVVKEVDISELVRVVRAVTAGETALDVRSSAMATSAFTRYGTDGARLGLSSRERQIVVLVAEGLTNREIAARAFCSESTVKFHLRNVMQKLGVHHRAAVAAAAAGLSPTSR